MRALVAQQQALAAARDLEVVHIVELTTFSDRSGSVIDTRFRFSTVALKGFTDAENSFTSECVTYLRAVPRVPETAMFHFPSLDQLSTNSLRQTMTFELMNARWDDGRRLSAVMEGTNVQFADVKYMRLFLPLGTMNDHKNKAIDLASFPSGSETVLFRGVVDTPVYGEEVLSFNAASRPIQDRALVLDDSSFLPEAIGQRVPQPYGSGVIIQADRLENPIAVFLTERINNASFTGQVGIESDLPLPTTGTFEVSIGQETDVICNGQAHGPDTIDIATRGTAPSSHDVGTACILEGTDATVDPIWVISAFEVSDVTTVLLGNTFDDSVPIDPADFTLLNPDETTIPGESIVTISMTTDKLLEKFPESPLTVRMYVVLDGRVVPFEFTEVYDFDDDTNWNDDPSGVHASVTEGGVHYQKVETPYNQDAINTQTEVAWGTQNADVLAVTEQSLQGGRSLRCTRDDLGTAVYGIDRLVALPFPDNSNPGPLLICNIRLDHGDLGDVISVGVLIGNSAIKHDVFGFDVELFAEDTWKTIICERGRQVAQVGGGFTGGTLGYFKIFVTDGDTGDRFYLDKIQTVDTTDMVAQKNDLANLDFSSSGDFYEVFARALRPEWIDTLFLSMSPETLAGTAAHTDFTRIDLTTQTSTWQQYRETATTGGTPDAANTESIRFRVTLLGTDVYQQVVSHTGQLWGAGASIDRLSSAADPGTPFIGGLTPGDLIVHPANIIRIHLSENGGISDSEIDFDGLQDLFDSVGSAAKWQFDMRVAGLSFNEILLRLGWEAGANILRVETTTGQQWRILVGNGSVADYGFGSPVAVIEEDDSRKTILYPRDSSTIFTDYWALFKLQSARDSIDDQSFDGVLQVSVRQNDIADFVSTDVFTAAEERYGRLVKQGPIFLYLVHDRDTAAERLGREATYRMDNRTMAHATLESWVGARAELGDIVNFKDSLNEVERKMRILRISSSTLGTPAFMIEVP